MTEDAVRVLTDEGELEEWLSSPSFPQSYDGFGFIYRNRWATDVDLRQPTPPSPTINDRGWAAARSYWLDGSATWRGVGEAMGVSAGRARDLARRAIGAALWHDQDDPFDELGVRARNVLRRAGFRSLEDAQAVGFDGLLAIQGVGRKTAEEIMGRPAPGPSPLDASVAFIAGRIEGLAKRGDISLEEALGLVRRKLGLQ